MGFLPEQIAREGNHSEWESVGMNISVKTNTYVFLTMLLFFIPVRWIISWVIAISFHELCHFLAVRLCNGKIYHLTIGLGGAEMHPYFRFVRPNRWIVACFFGTVDSKNCFVQLRSFAI